MKRAASVLKYRMITVPCSIYGFATPLLWKPSFPQRISQKHSAIFGNVYELLKR